MKTRKIRKGSTYKIQLPFEQPIFAYKPISAISQSAPVQITCGYHDITSGWRFIVSGISGGGSQLCAVNPNNPKSSDYHIAHVIDDNTIEINNIDSSLWDDYISGGNIRYAIPYDFTGCTAALQVRDSIDGSVVQIELTTENEGIVINVDGSIEITFSAEQTAGILTTESYFDAEIYFNDGSVMTAMEMEKIVWISEITKIE